MRWDLIAQAVIFVQAILLCSSRPVFAEDGSAVPGKSSSSRNEFACDLYRAVAEHKGNLFFSPTSIADVVGILELGATGETKSQIRHVLHVTDSDQAASSRQLDAAKAGIEFKTANRVWYRTGLKVEDSFGREAKKVFGADMDSLDFSSETAVEQINKWIDEGTNHKIPKILTAPLDRSSQLVIANFIYFKAEWAAPFDPKKTNKGFFQLANKEQITVRMMKSDLLDWKIWESPKQAFSLVELPYRGDGFSAVLLIPSQVDGLEEIEQGLTGDQLSQWLAQLDRSSKQKKFIKMPPFQLASQLTLNTVLKKLGMTSAFEQDAHFDAISSEPIQVLKMMHTALAKVDELGTEAAAATIGLAGSGIERNTLAADRPFLFMIRDQRSGAIHFMGRVSDPR